MQLTGFKIVYRELNIGSYLKLTVKGGFHH